MIKSYRFFVLLVLLSLNLNSYAEDIRIEDIWVRASAPGQDSAMMDMTITSKRPATLISLSSTASKSVELHSMVHENGMMKMREAKTLALPAGKRINLGESGYHLMLIGLNAPLTPGEIVQLTLTIKMPDSSIKKIDTKAEIKPLTANRTAPKKSAHQPH
jgi:hypothetical protein